MSQNIINKWLVAQIKPNSSDLAVRNLKRQGFDIFLPKMKITIKKGTEFINKEVPVFSGYLFIGFNPQTFNWTKINSTYGVSKVLVFNNKPYEISYDLILALKERYEANINPILRESLQIGDVIKFNSGPFVDLFARIENVDNTNRIWVLLKAMGGHRKLKLKQSQKLKYVKV